MWRSAISSDAAEAIPGRRGRHSALVPGFFVFVLAWLPTAAAGKVFLTLDEALELAFPGCEIERRTVFLTESQLERARQLAGVDIDKALVYPYEARCGGRAAGTAYLDKHRVRTLPEVLMVALDAEGRVRRIEILDFSEPEDYIPRKVWYEQFDAQELDPELDLKREIRGVTGATLTARATTDSVRRVLAIHQVLQEETPP